MDGEGLGKGDTEEEEDDDVKYPMGNTEYHETEEGETGRVGNEPREEEALEEPEGEVELWRGDLRCDNRLLRTTNSANARIPLKVLGFGGGGGDDDDDSWVVQRRTFESVSGESNSE